jgi:hydroxyacylglutathione hydrolase
VLFERMVSKGLAHYSYLIGDKFEAVVIDPRLDCEVYVERASSEGMRITNILETHRNEDYVVGSAELASRTGAQVWHADSQWDYRYGLAAEEEQRWKIARLEIEAIHTPGHTPGSMSYLLRDPGGLPWVVFTGDVLFAGEVGRVDLLGKERAPEMAGHLYDSIFHRLLPLGDQVLICPAHGAGSVCGEAIAERLWTTIGLERLHNPRLQNTDRDAFVADLLKSQPERPPYFTHMEKLNLEGANLARLPDPKPLSPQDFATMAKDAFVLDTRMELSFGAAHVPGAQSIWMDGLASFVGWYIPYEKPILLVTETNDLQDAARILIREGYDNIAGFLAGGMLSWHMSGRDSSSIKTLTVQGLCRLLDKEGPDPIHILDVRSDEELRKDSQVPNAQHIHVTQIPERMKEVPRNHTVHVFCGSGLRSMVAASFLQRQGWEDLAVVLGGMAGWMSIKCPISK